jgi:hypothetical protein
LIVVGGYAAITGITLQVAALVHAKAVALPSWPWVSPGCFWLW